MAPHPPRRAPSSSNPDSDATQRDTCPAGLAHTCTNQHGHGWDADTDTAPSCQRHLHRKAEPVSVPVARDAEVAEIWMWQWQWQWQWQWPCGGWLQAGNKGGAGRCSWHVVEIQILYLAAAATVAGPDQYPRAQSGRAGRRASPPQRTATQRNATRTRPSCWSVSLMR
ncbi:hypothetical protein BKA81DRAFT_152873 [Phyllosticta paracitricarpa]